MELVLNGDVYEHSGDGSLSSLLAELDLEPERVAVVVNDEIISREQRPETHLAAGDRVEVLTFAGGG